MNWKFWTWMKKSEPPVIDLREWMKVRDALTEKRKTEKHCPCSEEAAMQCKCISCPIKETCYVEKECYIATRKSPYPCFIRECSHRTELLGDKDGKEDGEKETEKPTGGESILGTVSSLPERLRGESTNGGIRESSMVSADGKSSARLDPVGTD
jgi:hypothetical protein